MRPVAEDCIQITVNQQGPPVPKVGAACQWQHQEKCPRYSNVGPGEISSTIRYHQNNISFLSKCSSHPTTMDVSWTSEVLLLWEASPWGQTWWLGLGATMQPHSCNTVCGKLCLLDINHHSSWVDVFFFLLSDVFVYMRKRALCDFPQASNPRML